MKRKIKICILFPVAFVHIASTAVVFFFPYAMLYGIEKSSNFMNELVIAYLRMIEP